MNIFLDDYIYSFVKTGIFTFGQTRFKIRWSAQFYDDLLLDLFINDLPFYKLLWYVAYDLELIENKKQKMLIRIGIHANN